VRDYIRNIDGFRNINIIERSNNLGLAKSIILGITDILEKYGKVISVEDDLICAPNFLDYMNEGLDYYENTSQIWAIGGHSHSFPMPTGYNKGYYLSIRTCSWGWATWKDRWETIDWNVADYHIIKQNRHLQREFNRGGNDLFDMLKSQMNGEIDSWAIRWDYSASKQNRYTVYPVHTMIAGIGMDGSGVHCTKNTRYIDQIPVNNVDYKFDKDISLNEQISKSVYNYYKKDVIHIIWSLVSHILDITGNKRFKFLIKNIGKKVILKLYK